MANFLMLPVPCSAGTCWKEWFLQFRVFPIFPFPMRSRDIIIASHMGQIMLMSQEVWRSLIWATQLSLVYLGHPALSYFSQETCPALLLRGALAAQEQLLSCHKLEAGVRREIEIRILVSSRLEWWRSFVSCPWSKRKKNCQEKARTETTSLVLS